MEKAIEICLSLGKFRPEHIMEIDLGPFKHKTDIGRPQRVAAYTLVHTALEKFPEKVPSASTIEIVLDGL